MGHKKYLMLFIVMVLGDSDARRREQTICRRVAETPHERKKKHFFSLDDDTSTHMVQFFTKINIGHSITL
jgi:hypothetical protein